MTDSTHSPVRTPARIRREIRQTKNQLSETLHTLSDQLSPTRITDEARSLVRDKAEEIAMETSRRVKDNAIPLALIGCGLALWWRGRRRSDPDRDESTRPAFMPRLPESVQGDLAESSSEDDASLTTRVAQHASDAYHASAAATASALGKVRDGSRELSSSAVARARSGRDASVEYYDAQPLLVGAAALAFGAALGAAIPTTSTEHRRLGPIRDQLLDEAAASAESKVRHAHELLEEKAAETRSKLSPEA